jgi:hypothetical protein
MQNKPTGINAEWHKKHPMTKNPTIQQRIDWHLEHQANCGCRPGLPAKLPEEMKMLKIKVPFQRI